MPVSKIQRSSILTQVSKRLKNPDLVKKLEEILADDSAAEELNSMFLSRSEATKLVQDIKKQENDLAAQQSKLASDYSSLQAWEVRAKQEEITAKQQAIEVAKEAQQVLKTLRDKANNDTLVVADLEAAYLNPKIASLATSTTPTPAPATSTTPTPAATSASKKETPMAQSNNSTASTANSDDAGRAFIQGIGKLFKLQTDHQKLFNESLDVDALIATALQENRPVEDVYNEAFDVQGKLKEVEQARFEAAVNERVTAVVNEKLATMLDPTGKSGHIGDFAGIMKKETSAVFSGLGMGAKELDAGFRASLATPEELAAQQAQFKSSIASIPNQRDEERQIAQEFAESLAKHS